MQKLTSIGNITHGVTKPPYCWNFVDEYEDRERQKQVAAQYYHYDPAPTVLRKPFIEPAPAPVHPRFSKFTSSK